MFDLGTIHDKIKKSGSKMATEIQTLFEAAIKSNALPQSSLFDQNYLPIAGTDPQKFKTKFDAYCDMNLPIIQEKFLQSIPTLIYAMSTDINGYIPTHNNVFAKQPTGNYKTDLVSSRSKRVYDDPTGIRCGSHTQEFLLQTYKRDTGEIFHDLSIPIYVNGQHWGGIRMGYKAESAH